MPPSFGLPTRNRLAAALLAALVALAFAPALAQEGADLGESLVMQGNAQGALPCASCHMPDGAGVPAANYPRLAGLHADYIAKQLEDFQADLRRNPVMAPIAKALSEEEIAAVAAYYAARRAPFSAPDAEEELLERGEFLVKNGNWSNFVAPCASCHAGDSLGVGASFPPIAGQSAGYIAAQLHAWRSGERRNDPLDLMHAVADRLQEEEIDAVAAYLSIQPPAGAEEE